MTFSTGPAVFGGKTVKFDTSKLTIICLGAITELRKEKTTLKQPMGFGSVTPDKKVEYTIKPEDLIDSDVDIIVVSDFENYCDYPMYDYTKLESKYDSYHFDGNLYFENFLYYLNSFTIYVSKDILIEEK